MWRYKAIAYDGAPSGARGAVRQGEHAGETAADVRAALRRIGLQVIDIKPLRREARPRHLGSTLSKAVSRHLRRRRMSQRAELYDSLATLVDSGTPLIEAIASLTQSQNQPRAARHMLVELDDSVRSGSGLGDAMSTHTAWFDAVEVAMVRASEHAGSLPATLQRLSERQAASQALAQKLIGALAYPAIVACVGVGVVVFLSTNTLPALALILEGADIAVPTLTRYVMAIGSVPAQHGPALTVALGVGALLGVVLWRFASRHARLATLISRLRPRVSRRIALASTFQQLGELLNCGIPFVEALRVIAPTATGNTELGLRAALIRVADALERGVSLPDAFRESDPKYFDSELQKLLAVGESAGDVAPLLRRIGERYERQSRRLIDRLAALLEPAVILTLAFFVGVVVMAAVLPLIRLQEVL